MTMQRPTVHARNLFHISTAMYDTWTLYADQGKPYFIEGEFDAMKMAVQSNDQSTVEEAISFVAYRLIKASFVNSPGVDETFALADQLMIDLGYDAGISSTIYETGNASSVGNAIAEIVINYGYTDGAREITGYDNAYYEPF